MIRTGVCAAAGLWLLSVLAGASPGPAGEPAASAPAKKAHQPALFVSSADCFACHSGMRSRSGEEVSIGADWRASMMANSGRDPYWIASVRREIADHPMADAAIQDECSVCHLPMARTAHRADGKPGEVFAHMPPRHNAEGLDRLAQDGVSCTVCHQITTQKLGTPDSYTGGYVIDTQTASHRSIYGPFEIDKGRTTVMRSSSGFTQEQGRHIQQSDLCATCHTLVATARGPDGREIGRLPEQMPYEEWKHSEYATTRTCQDCHMPAVEDTPVSSVLGTARRVARHQFAGGNFFMLRMLNRYREELAVTASSTELDRAVSRTIANLREAASLSIDSPSVSGGIMSFGVTAENLSGHKLPTGYPSRRVWLHVVVRDRDGAVLFESGAVQRTGQITGNDNDLDGMQVEPHYTEITRSDQVQIYEAVMSDSTGCPTTGLLNGVKFLKDNRLLPLGFEKATASPDIRVVGAAEADTNFSAGTDRVRYVVDTGAAEGPFQVDAELQFQPIGYRWVRNLTQYDASEAKRFVRYYDSLAPVSSQVLARSTARVASSSR